MTRKEQDQKTKTCGRACLGAWLYLVFLGIVSILFGTLCTGPAYPMESQIITFDGGKNVRLEPWLLQPNEAAEADNVDVTHGSLRPQKGLGTTSYSQWTGPSDTNIGHGTTSIYLRPGTSPTSSANWIQTIYDWTFSQWNNATVVSQNGGISRAFEDKAGVRRLLGITGPSTPMTALATTDLTMFAKTFRFVAGTPDSVNYAPTSSASDPINDTATECQLFYDYTESLPYTTATKSAGGYLVLGWAGKYNGMFVDLTVPGQGTWDVKFEYCIDPNYTGSGVGGLSVWRALTVTKDDTDAFRAVKGTRYVTWQIPEDWAVSAVSGISLIRIQFINIEQIDGAPKVRKIWPAMAGIQDATRNAQDSTAVERKYIYTYKNSTYGFETHPAPAGWDYDALAVKVVGAAYSYVALTIPRPAYSSGSEYYNAPGAGVNGVNVYEYPVDKICIYRYEGAGYFLVEEVTITGSGGTQTYQDKADWAVIVLNRTVDDAVGNNPPVAGNSACSGSYAYPSYIFQHNGSFFAVFRSVNSCLDNIVKYNLFWSKVGTPYYWPRENYIGFTGSIQGINRVGADLLVLTSRGPWRVSGAGSFLPTPIPSAESYDCTANATIVPAEGFTLWCTKGGIVTCDGNSAKEIASDKLLDPVEGLDFSAGLTAAYFKKQYLLFGANNTVVMDLRYGTPRFFSVKDIHVDSAYLYPDGNTLYVGTSQFGGSNEAGIRKWAEGNDLSYTYLSPAYTGGKLERKKLWDRMELSYTGPVTVRLGVDQTGEVSSSTLTGSGDQKAVVFFPVNTSGQRAAVQFEGTGTVRHATLYYEWLDTFKDRKIFRGAVVRHTDDVDGVQIYLDGTLNDTWNLAGNRHSQIHFNPVSNANQGYIPQLRWPGTDVLSWQWVAEDYAAYPTRDLWSKVGFTHDADVTVKMYVDGTLKATKTLTGTGATDLFFPAMTIGQIPSLVWYSQGVASDAENVRNFVYEHARLNTFNKLLTAKTVYLNHEGIGTAYLYVDGYLKTTQKFGKRLLGLGNGTPLALGNGRALGLDNTFTDKKFSIPPGTAGWIWQLQYVPDLPNEGWIHNADFAWVERKE